MELTYEVSLLNLIHGWGWLSRWEHLLSDLFSLAAKLEELGFCYSNSKVIVVEIN